MMNDVDFCGSIRNVCYKEYRLFGLSQKFKWLRMEGEDLDISNPDGIEGQMTYQIVTPDADESTEDDRKGANKTTPE